MRESKRHKPLEPDVAATRARGALRRTDDQALETLRVAFDTAREGILVCDAADRVVFSNQAYLKFARIPIEPGMAFEAVLRQRLAAGDFPHALGREDDWLRERMAERRSPANGIEMQAGTGWLHVSDQRTADGGTLTFVVDISERKAAEMALTRSEARFRVLAELSSDWFWEQDTEFRFTSISTRGARHRSLEAASLGKARWDLPGLSPLAGDWRAHRAALEAHQTFDDFVVRRVAPHGEVTYLQSSGTPVFGEHGRFAGYHGLTRDVTEKVRAEQDALAASARLRDGLEYLGEMIVLTDADDRIVLANQRFLEFNAPVAEFAKPGCFYADHLRAGIRLGLFPDAVGREQAWLAERIALRHQPSGPVERRRQDGRWLLVDDQRLPDGGIVSYGVEITDRKRAEESAQAARRQLGLALEFARATVWDFDLVDDVLTIAEGWKELSTGPSGERSVTRAAMINLIHPDERAKTLTTFVDALKGRTSIYAAEYRVKTLGGKWLWILSRGQVSQRDASGRALRMVGINIDITERKLAEEEVQAIRTKLRLALDFSKVALWDYDVEHDRVSFTEGHRDLIVGRHDKEMINRRELAMSIHPDDLADAIPRYTAALKGDVQQYVAEYRHRSSGGTWTWVHSRGQVSERGTDGRALRMMGVNIDITERKAAEAELRASEQRFKSLVALSSDIFWETDANHRFTSLQSGESSRIKFQATSELGTARWDIPYTSPDEAAWLRHRAQMDAHEVFLGFELGRPIEDGKQRFTSVSGEPVFDENGAFVGYRGVSRDITARKSAELALRSTNADLEQRIAERTSALKTAYRELESFSYSVSHDLRAPLRSISGYAGLLREDDGERLSEEGRGHLAIIDESARHMGRLIDALLSLAQTSRQALQRESVDLGGIARLVAKELAGQFPHATLTIATLPPIEGDATLLRQVFTNLIGNALKYSAKANPQTVEVGTWSNGDERVFFVRDNGVGFDMAYVDKLFQAFGRLHTDAEFQGTGIGLVLTKLIVERHGGRIWAESQPGAGAQFNFTLGPQSAAPAGA